MAQSGVSYYVAPIALMEDLVEGATVSGTLNGVQVSGTVRAGHVDLYVIARASLYQSSGNPLVAKIRGDAGNYEIALEKQPESDLTIHLTQIIPAHAVTIPEEYLELTETNEAISAAMSAVNTAQSAANTAQSAANTAQSAASSAQTTANAAKTKAEATAERYKDTQATIGDNTISGPRRSYILLDIGPSSESHPARIVLHSDRGGAPRICTTVKVQSVVVDSYDKPAQLNLTGETVYAENKSSLDTVEVTGLSSVIIASATSGSTKKFRITVDDTGTIKATEVTE